MRQGGKPSRKERAEQLLVRLGLVADLAGARARIMAGDVFVTLPSGGERRVDKAGELLFSDATFRINEGSPYVSRGGVKLAHALDHFAVDPSEQICADIGVSTGGFTDCLLKRGAKKVHAVDVGYGQIAWKLRSDPRVILYERTNARHLPPGFFGEPVALIVIDVSFIGLSQLLPAVAEQLAPKGRIVALVKPQFEAAPEEVDEGGVVQDEGARLRALERVRQAANATGLDILGQLTSPLTGADGNVEYLLLLQHR